MARTRRLPAAPTISVVIPAFNEEAYLAEALQALRGQELVDDVELLVVDNASTDQTAAIARAFGATVIIEQRQGVAYARETGFRAAASDLIATTDADTVVPVNWLATIVRHFSEKPKMVALGGPVSYTFHDRVLQEVIDRAIPLLHDLDQFVHQGKPHLVGANLAVRRQAFAHIGGFRTDLSLGEDLDLAHRLQAVGPVHFLPLLRVKTSDRRLRSGGPLVIWRYLQNYLLVTKPGQPLRRRVERLLTRPFGTSAKTLRSRTRSSH